MSHLRADASRLKAAMRAAVIDPADLRELPDGRGWRCGPLLVSTRVRLPDPLLYELVATLDGLSADLHSDSVHGALTEAAISGFVKEVRAKWPVPLLCPACGTLAVPVKRVGYGPWDDEVRDGDAVYAFSDVITGKEGPGMDLQCRSCRRHLATSDDGDALAAVALDTFTPAPAGRAGLWRREDGRALAWVSPLLPEGADSLPVPPDVRGLLRAARRAVAVLRVAGMAARFASGHDLRTGLGAGETFDLSAGRLSCSVGGQPVKLALRPPRVRLPAEERTDGQHID